MPYAPILATLGYVLAPSGDQVLLIHRNTRPDDHHFGKYNGLGGKIDPDEDVATSMRREIAEEAGVECLSMQLRGTISWPGFGKNGQDWFGFLFLINEWSGTPKSGNPEGSLEWVSIPKLLAGEINVWPGDRYFLPLVFDKQIRQFHGILPYRDGQPISWHYSLL